MADTQEIIQLNNMLLALVSNYKTDKNPTLLNSIEMLQLHIHRIRLNLKGATLSKKELQALESRLLKNNE